MGWRDQSTPLNPTPQTPDIASAPTSTPQSGWRGASTPLNQTPTPAPVPTTPAPDNAGAGGVIPTLFDASKYLPNWMTRPIAKTEDPLSAARDYALSAADAATFGHLPSALTPSIAQAHANLGALDPLATTIGYAAGPGKIIGPLTRGAVALAPEALSAGRVGSALAAGSENAIAAGAGAQGHGGSASDIAQATVLGGFGGALGGALGGGAGPTPKAPEVGAPGRSGAPSTGMYAQREQAYAPLDSIYFDRSTANNAAAQGLNTIKTARDPQNMGAGLGISPQVNNIMGDLVGQPAATGRNIQEASRALRSEGSWQAHQFANQLDDALGTAQPIAGGGVGDAAAAKSAGDMWHQRIQDLERLSQEGLQGQPAPTKSAVQQTRQFYDPNSPQGQALSNLQAAQQPGFNWWTAKHIAGPLIGAAGLGLEGYVNPAEKQNPWISGAREALEGLLLFKGVHGFAAPRPESALNAARYTIGTGQPISTPTGRVGDALMNLLYGRAASGQSPY
jgi:hypothetical protein